MLSPQRVSVIVYSRGLLATTIYTARSVSLENFARVPASGHGQRSPYTRTRAHACLSDVLYARADGATRSYRHATARTDSVVSV